MSGRRVTIDTDSEDDMDALLQGELFVPNLNLGGMSGGHKKRKKNRKKGAEWGRSGTSPGSAGSIPSNVGAPNVKPSYHARKAQAQKAEEQADKRFGKIKDPRLIPDNAAYFTNTIAYNLGIREDEKISDAHTEKVKSWTLQLVSSQPQTGQCNLEQIMGVPIKTYRRLPVYFVDAQNFHNMMGVMTLSSINELALDLECNADFYEGNTALIQLGLRNVIFLLDPFSCFSLIKEHLQPILESPKILKIMAGMANDIMYLFKDFGIRPVGILDLQHLFMKLPGGGSNLPSVDTMCRTLLKDFVPPPDCTLRNWTRRPLEEDAMIEYAASDVRVLLEIWDVLKELTDEHQMQEAIIASNKMLLRNFSRKSHKTPSEDLETARISTLGASPEQRQLYELLHQWRERYSKFTDSHPHNLLSTRTLWNLAGIQGSSVNEMTLPDRGIPASILQRQSKTLELILNERDAGIFERMANCKCHNCFKLGHAAKICPYPRDPKAARKWEAENPEDHKKQKKRRRDNYKRNVRARRDETRKEVIPVCPQSSSQQMGRSNSSGKLATSSERISIPRRIVGALIGQNGSRIRGYQSQSGARIQIIGESLPNGDRTCVITGSSSEVELAKTLVESFLTSQTN